MKIRRFPCHVFFLIAYSFSAGAAEEYPGPWKSEPKIELVKTLVANRARGCGEFWWRTRDGEAGPGAEYLVYCTRDGKNWTAWILWPLIGRAQGPAAILPEIPPPH